MIEAVMEKLLVMKLHGMAEKLEEQLNTPAYRDLDLRNASVSFRQGEALP